MKKIGTILLISMVILSLANPPTFTTPQNSVARKHQITHKTYSKEELILMDMIEQTDFGFPLEYNDKDVKNFVQTTPEGQDLLEIVTLLLEHGQISEKILKTEKLQNLVQEKFLQYILNILNNSCPI